MAIISKALTFLVLLFATIAYFAQSVEAARGPLITHKVTELQ